MGMHTTILGTITLVAAVGALLLRRYLAAVGLLLIALALAFSFTILILPAAYVDVAGIGLTVLFATGCALTVLALRRP